MSADRDPVEGDPALGDPVIIARELTRHYGDLVAVDRASFEVHCGEVLGILGPNGAGKTTTVEMLEGLVEPTHGTASVVGFEVTEQPNEVKARIGVQLQASSYHQFLTLRELLELFGSFYPQHAEPEELLDRVGLLDRADSRMDQLSGGLRQRFSLVAAIVNQPELVFFDEPTAGLDPDARRDLWGIVEDIRSRGATVVLTTHYMEEAERLCDRIAFLNEGRIVALDTPRALVRRLASPYLVRVTASAPLPESATEGIGAGEIELVERRDDEDGHHLAIRVSDAPAAAAAITEAARAADARVLDLTIEAATLDDVFVAVTGRGLAD